MKTESMVLLAIAGYLFYQWSKQPASNPQPGNPAFVGPVYVPGSGGSGIQWVNCNDPGADKVMCELISQAQGGL